MIDFCPIEKIKSQLPNVNIHTHKLEVYGICEECQRKSKLKYHSDYNTGTFHHLNLRFSIIEF